VLIFICGFMGSGKTHLLEKLKENSNSGWEFLDLDQEIFQKFNEYDSFAAFIEKMGWDFFRQEELSEIEKLCFSAESKKLVVALGGGALSDESLSVIQQTSNCHLIWAKTPFEITYKRIEGDAERPLVKEGKDYLQNLFNERTSFYGKADIHLGMGGQNDVQQMDDILHIIDSQHKN